MGPPKVPEDAIPVVSAPPARHVSLSAISGKGIWLTLFRGQQLDVPNVVALAQANGLHQLWLRTGSSREGFFGGAILRKLVVAAHVAGIAVIAWDFPTLSDPARDARRAIAALRAGADGFAADIESPSEGTYLTIRRVAYYLSLVRAASGNKPLVAIVFRPTSYRLSVYPYRTEALFVDAFAPMVYWSCDEPGAAVADSISALAPLRPVVPIGQDYNMASEGGRHGLPSGRAIWRFLDVAHRSGAIGASLYDLESGGRPQLAALAGYPWVAPGRPPAASSVGPFTHRPTSTSAPFQALYDATRARPRHLRATRHRARRNLPTPRSASRVRRPRVEDLPPRRSRVSTLGVSHRGSE
jgi:hypothetical protein